MKKTKCQESCNHIGDRHSSPEEAKSERQFMMLVEVGQIQDNLSGISYRRCTSSVSGVTYIGNETSLKYAKE